MRRVVITGLGAISPVGNDVNTLWASLIAGKSGVGPITLFDASRFETRFAAEVKGFDPAALLGRKDARRMDRFTQFAVATTVQALADSGLKITPDNALRVGVVIGSGVGGIGTICNEVQTLHEKGVSRVSPFMVPMMLSDTAPGWVAINYGIRGPNLSLASACATGSNVIGEAAEWIRHGRVEAVIAGSAEAGVVPLAVAGFNVMGALSRRNDAPEKASRPFDKNRDGFVTGEGAGILILEEYEHAKARGAKLYAEIVGYGSTADAYHITAPEETGAGAAAAMQLALDQAGLKPTDIDYLNAHGTSTPLNDKSETAAIKRAFGEAAYDVPVSSTKSMTGHLLGGAGSLEAVVCVKVLQEHILPPTINYETPDPECDLDYVPNTARPKTARHVMSNSFGFGGHNACIILAAIGNGQPAPDVDQVATAR
ncbi:MAG TPA: beta-ketoacyl-ACP synthase II [Anaerolineae bacterium]|nr:beta-ketoacyl-ACP synthase II [Anaerolineae bacterium]